jgi:hypothetical protein
MMSQPFDPYAPPRAQEVGGPEAAAIGGVRPRLFSPGQIGVAALLGSALAGAVLFGINEQRLGKSGGLAKALVGGAVITGVIMFIGSVLPESFPQFIFGLAQFLALRFYAQAVQGDAYRHHLDSGGLRASNWGVVGAIAAAVVVVMTVIVVLVFGFGLE